MSIPSDQRKVLEAMGIALLLMQNAERVIRLCMTFVLQKQPPLTLDLLQNQEESERAKTIGYFLSELRKRANIEESFDLLLKDFLKNRNDFIHDLSRIPKWGLRTPERSATSLQFLHLLIQQTDEVQKVFVGLVLAWQEQAGLTEPPLPEHEWFLEVDAAYKPLAFHIFGGDSA